MFQAILKISIFEDPPPTKVSGPQILKDIGLGIISEMEPTLLFYQKWVKMAVKCTKGHTLQILANFEALNFQRKFCFHI